jgi:hypothetical protein
MVVVGLVTVTLLAAPDWRPTLTGTLLTGADAAEVTLDDRAREASPFEPSADVRPAPDDAGTDGGNRFEVADDTLGAGRVACMPDGCARWSLALGGQDRLAADADHVVIATASRILAIDARAGQGRWQIAVPPGDGPARSVHLTDDAVLLARPGRLELRRLEDGGARWSRPLEVRDVTDVQQAGATLLVTAGTVPGTDGAGVLALEIETGAVAWVRGVPDVRRAVLRVDGPHLAVQTSPERIVGVDPASGRSRWVRAGRVGFTDAAVLLAAPDGRVERLVTATGGSGATISVNVADVLADGRWTVVRDRDASSRLVDDRGRTLDERAQPALALAGGAAVPGGTLVAYRDGDDIEVVHYADDGVVLGRQVLPGGLGVWGSAPRLGLRGEVGLVISQDMRRSLRLSTSIDTAEEAADPAGDGTPGAPAGTTTRTWPAGTATSALGDVLVTARAAGVELQGGGEPVRIDGRLRQVVPLGDDVLVRTADGVVQIAGSALRP